MLKLEKFGQLLSYQKIQIAKPLEQNYDTDFLSQIPKMLKKLGEQAIQDVAKHGYKPIRFISKCKYGFVFSASKGRVRYAIKVQEIMVKGEDDYINLAERYNGCSEALSFYNHPYLLSLIEHFQTNDNYYTVTEECVCNLKEFLNQIRDKKQSRQPCNERYAVQLLSIFEHLSMGPISDTSNRFISHVKPSDVLVSYDTSIRLNPTFGRPIEYLGSIPFCDAEYSVMNKNVACEKRFHKSLSHLLMFMAGLSEQQILFSELTSKVDDDIENADINTADSVLNKSLSIENGIQISYYYQRHGTIKLENMYSFDVIYTQFGDVGRHLRIKLERLQDSHFGDKNQSDLICIRKNRFISLDDYEKVYRLSKSKMTEEEEDDLTEIMNENKYFFKFVQYMKRNKKILDSSLPVKLVPSFLSRQIYYSLEKLFSKLKYLQSEMRYNLNKLERKFERKKEEKENPQKEEIDNTNKEDEDV